MDSPFSGPLTALCSHTSFFSEVLKQSKTQWGSAAAAGAFEFFLKRKLTLPNQCTSCVCGIRQGEIQDLLGTALDCRISSCWWGVSNCVSELQFVVFFYPGICEVCVNHLVTIAGSDPIIRGRT